jgi:hypothetical protein
MSTLWDDNVIGRLCQLSLSKDSFSDTLSEPAAKRGEIGGLERGFKGSGDVALPAEGEGADCEGLVAQAVRGDGHSKLLEEGLGNCDEGIAAVGIKGDGGVGLPEDRGIVCRAAVIVETEGVHAGARRDGETGLK